MFSRLPVLFSLLFGAIGLGAQNCDYQLILTDTFGDGWDGAEVTVRVNGVATGYTLTNDPAIDDGTRSVIFFPVADGDSLEIGFAEGAMPAEHGIVLLGNDDEPIFTAGNPVPAGDIIFATRVRCLRCVSPPTSTVDLFRVRCRTTDFRFRGVTTTANPTYRIEYGPGSFDPAVDDVGTTLLTQDTSGRISDLLPDTLYTFWVSTICPESMDTAARRGPFTIQTQRCADVGVTMIGSPESGCDLGSEEVTIGITNFGGEPQAFFDVDFAINGQPGGVNRPADGIFTGVVGVDSTEFFTFDVRALLAEPGTYEITMWTALEDDEDRTNDTMSFSVTHTPLLTGLPYFEDFEANDGFWFSTAADFSAGNSWAWGTPGGTLLSRAPAGTFAWATGLTTPYGAEETSFLHSPCFDFTALTSDPLFSAVVQLDLEAGSGFDRLALEMSRDRGQTWERIENSAGTIFWYNDLVQQFWIGDGAFPAGGPVMVSAVLSGAAGEEIQLRFRFESDATVAGEGVLVDAVSITERYTTDLAAVTGSAFSQGACGTAQDTVAFRFANRGQRTVADVALNYRVNGGTVITENFPGTLAGGQSALYRFQTLFDATAAAVNRIEVWTAQTGDEEINNDTTVFFFNAFASIPFVEDFDDGQVPANWTLGQTLNIGLPAGGGSPALTGTVTLPADSLRFLTTNYGFVEVADELRMDISTRQIDGMPTSDMIDVRVLVYPDCAEVGEEAVAFTMSGDTTLLVDLSEYAGSFVALEVLITNATAAQEVHIDNFGILRCDGLALVAETTGVSAADVADGAATVTPGAGFGPYTYQWSNGAAEPTVTDLPFGAVSVVVTDAFGCADELMLTIDLASSADEPISLLEGMVVFPNPTTGQLALVLDLPAATAVGAVLYDLTGRALLRRDFGRQTTYAADLDLSGLPAGVYLLRVQAAGAARTVRIIKR